MSSSHHNSHRRTSRQAFSRQRQVIFFCITFGILAIGLIVGLLYLMNGNPMTIH